MRVTLKELLDQLGVGYELSPYETCPWSVYDTEKGLTCSAEVRMDGEGKEIEAELQLMHDTPPAGKPGVEQVVWILCHLSGADQKWEPKALKLRGQDDTAVFGWGEKSAEFFAACVQELKMDKIPDIDELIDSILHSKERFAGGRGGSSKA